MARILIVDDHPLYREGVIGALTRRLPSTEVIGAATVKDGETLLAARDNIDLVLIDVHLPQVGGFEALALYGRRFPGVARVLISGQALEEPMLEQAMRGGASGFIPKALSVGQMVDAICTILGGGIFVPRLGAADPIVEGEPARAPAAPGSGLLAADGESAAQAISVRQLEVLALIGEGRSNKEIARALDIAERTVKAHATRLFEVLGAANRTQAVLAGQRLGLLAS